MNQQNNIMPLQKPPKWLRRPVGASFGVSAYTDVYVLPVHFCLWEYIVYCHNYYLRICFHFGYAIISVICPADESSLLTHYAMKFWEFIFEKDFNVWTWPSLYCINSKSYDKRLSTPLMLFSHISNLFAIIIWRRKTSWKHNGILNLSDALNWEKPRIPSDNFCP